MNTETLIGVAIVAFVASVCQSVTAFGFGLLMVPMLTLVWGVKPAVVTSIILGTAFMAPLLFEVRTRVELRQVAPLLAGSAVGLPAGIALLARVDADVLQIAIGVVVLVACATFFVSPRQRFVRPHLGTALLTGGISGALRGATSMSGPPIVLYALSAFGDDMERFRANVLGVLMPAGLLSIAGVLVAGLVDLEIVLACLAAGPTMVAGALAGGRLRDSLPPALFRRVVLLVLVATTVVVFATALARF